MDSITHFSHEHPLQLLKQKPTEEGKKCYACEVRLTDEREHLVEVYGCELCKEFFLHKYCAQLPMEIVHKLHENHSLFLVLKPPGSYHRNRCHCSPEHPNWLTCPLSSNSRRFFYCCYVCDFILETECAFREKGGIVWRKKEGVFHHPSHKHHPLMVLSRPASLLCDACGVKGNEDLFYHCSPCHYWIHKRCAMLPSTTTRDIHSHPLTLSFIGLPSHHRNFYYDCDICGDRLSRYNNEYWLYYCDLCRYFVHIRCMEKKKPQIKGDYEGLIKDLPHLPVTDKSVELIQRFLLKNNSFDDIQPEMKIFSHKHPLVYSNEEFLEDGEEILCDACIEPIFSPPYYHCAECRYFLHITCAKLPLQLHRPIHSHQLSLTSEMRFDETLTCNRCERESNGFFFYCTTEGCEFYLDLSCAALPKVIMHENHNHPLVQLSGESVEPQLFNSSFIHEEMYMLCKGCGWRIASSHWIGCTPCKFYLHMECVLLPKTRRHRYDSNHPLIFRFPPHSYHPKPFDCYQCEREIDPNYWLYHCEECDLSFHLECFNFAFMVINMKFGQKAQIGSHPHPLMFVYEASVSSSKCHDCERTDTAFTLECETCNFRLCSRCVKKIEL